MSLLESLKIKGFLKTTGMLDVAQSLKNDGFKATLKRFGWKFLLVIFVCYLIRDVILYILIPLWAARFFIN